MTVRGKFWCGTDNKIEHLEDWKTVFTPGEKIVRFLVFSHERGNEEKKDHIQWFMQLYEKKSFQQVKAMLPEGTHIELCKAGADANVKYCSKADTHIAGPFKFGEMATQGSRTDIIEFCDSMKKRKSIAQLWDQHAPCMLKHRKMVDVYISDHIDPRWEAPKVTVIWGPTRTGKTTLAIKEATDICGDKNKIFIQKDPHWWDTYAGQKCMVIDEFNPRLWVLSEILTLLDWLPHRVRVKGSFMQFNTPHIWITSNIDPKNWFVEDYYFQHQVLPRINFVKEMKKLP